MIILASHIIAGSITIFVILCLITYVVAVVNRHVTPILPFISQTGNLPIESCIFSLCFNFAAAISIFTVIIRHCQVQDVLDNSDTDQNYKRRFGRLNWKSTVYGVLGSLGLSIVGNFQQKITRPVHVTGFFLIVIFLYIYLINQTHFSFTCLSSVTTRRVKRCRFAFVVVCTIIFFVSPILFLYNFFVAKERLVGTEVYPIFQPSWVRMVGAILEWLMFFIVVAFVCTFYNDFKKVSLEKDGITLLR